MAESEIDIKQLIETALEKLDDKLDKKGTSLKPREKLKLQEILEDVLQNEKSPKEAIGMSKKQIESMYGYAYNLFTHGKYTEAQHMLYHLMSLDPDDPRFPLGCGAALHQKKDFQRAASYYVLAAHIDKKSPIAVYYLYDCFKNLNEPRSALLMLENVIHRAGSSPEWSALKERATLTMKSLAKEIEESEKSNISSV